MAHDADDRNPARFFWAWGVVAFVAGGAVGILVHAAWPIPLHAFITWAYAFSTSAGLGGVAALLVAIIAYRGVTRSTDMSRRTALESSNTVRETALEAQWWENARWAVDRLLSVSDIAEEGDNESLEGDVQGDDANINLLVDQDAYAAIIMLDYLGENAPSEKAASFALDALGAVLGVPSGGDNVDSESVGDIPHRPANRTLRGEQDL